MNAPALIKIDIPSLAMEEPELIKALESSVYPGAELASIKLVIGYCRAVHKDPMKRVVHIVPMDIKVKKPEGGTEFKKRDVIMEGIASYRMDAARTGQYAGLTEPEFGPMKKLTWSATYQDEPNGPEKTREVEFEYPEWCRITASRIVDGRIVAFTAKELWLENYATNARGSKVPNAMWTKRPFGQLAKCAEAQALRKAFPDTVSAAPTAEEMAGKTLNEDDVVDGVVTGKKNEPLPELLTTNKDPEASAAGSPGSASTSPGVGTDAGASGNNNGNGDKPMSDGEKAHIRSKLKAASLTEVDLRAKFGVDVEGLKAAQFKPVKDWIGEAKKS